MSQEKEEEVSLSSAVALLMYDLRKGKSLDRGLKAAEKFLKRIIAKRIPNPDHREDVFSNVLVRIIQVFPEQIYKRLKLGHADQEVIGFGTGVVIVITTQVCIDWLRREATRKRHEAYSLDAPMVTDSNIWREDYADLNTETGLLNENHFLNDLVTFLASENISPYPKLTINALKIKEQLRRLRRIQAFSMLLVSRRTSDKETLTFEDIELQLRPQFVQTGVGCSLGTIHHDCIEMALLFFQWHNGSTAILKK